ncbi:MAG: zinc ribbon domain-containing protein, partial [Actinomycetota bacterium]|nr:zinc ribbon domain-containing protein [Actinomycetota bacterium]
MNCRYCGTELPDEALFCPECGRAVHVNIEVLPEPAPVAAPAGLSIADLAFSSPEAASEPPLPQSADNRELPDGTSPGEPLDEHGAAPRCPQCGEPMADGDIFCGECGFVLRTVAPPSADQLPDANSANLPTTIIVLPDLVRLESPGLDSAEPEIEGPEVQDSEIESPNPIPAAEPVAFGALDALGIEDAPEGGPEDRPEEIPVDELIHDTPAQVAAAAAAVPPVDPDLEFDEPLPFALPMATKATPSPRSRPIPDPFPWGTDRPLREDIEATRIIADVASGVRFVLQFSTGESVTVLG